MKKIFALFVIGLFGSMTVMAQENNNIAITAHVYPEMGFPGTSGDVLRGKLERLVVANGYGAYSNEFILTAKAYVVSKEVTPVVPPKELVTMDISLYVVGVREQVIVAEHTLTLSNVGDVSNEAAIYAGVFNKINPRSPVLRNFMASARDKIVEYYAKRIPAIMTEADAYIKRSEYEKAVVLLGTVPTCLPEYPQVAEKLIDANQHYIDKLATMALQNAKSKMALRDYVSALDCLVGIDPTASNYGEVEALIAKVEQALSAKEQEAKQQELEKAKLQMEMAQRAHDDAVMLEKIRLESATTSVANLVVDSATEAVSSKSLTKWLFGKLAN